MNHLERLRELLVERSLERGDFMLASGARSPYYIDARRTTFSAEAQSLVGIEGFRALREAGLDPQWIAGLTLGADPVACAIAHRSWLEGSPIQAFTVRKDAKEHGAERRIEGGLSPGARAVVVEDALTTGRSPLAAASVLEAGDVHVLGVLTLVDREAGGEDRIREKGYALIRLFTAGELLAAAGPGP